MDLSSAKKIMGKNFIGLEELNAISAQLGIDNPIKSKRIPKIIFTEQTLKREKNNAVLILGIPKGKNGKPITINFMRAHFGMNPKKSEPCFYNQDWYIDESFAHYNHLKLKWYLIAKKINPQSRGKEPNVIKSSLVRGHLLPFAILASFTFFAYYFHTKGEILWKHDFIWCSDRDKNGDQIYVGRYQDPHSINRNGFNIHRHLKIRSFYGLAPEIRS